MSSVSKKTPQRSSNASEQDTASLIKLHSNKMLKTSIIALKLNLKTKPSAELEYNWNPCRPLSDCAWIDLNPQTHKASSGWWVKLSQQSFFKAAVFSCWSCGWLRFARDKMIFTPQAVGCKSWTDTRGVAPFSFSFSISAKKSTYSTSQSRFQTWKPIHLSYSTFPQVTLLLSRNATRACVNQLRDLKKSVKNH